MTCYILLWVPNFIQGWATVIQLQWTDLATFINTGAVLSKQETYCLTTLFLFISLLFQNVCFPHEENWVYVIYSTQNQSYNIIFKGLNLKQSHRSKNKTDRRAVMKTEDKRRNDKWGKEKKVQEKFSESASDTNGYWLSFTNTLSVYDCAALFQWGAQTKANTERKKQKNGSKAVVSKRKKAEGHTKVRV